jgi:hypothetical protein
LSAAELVVLAKFASQFAEHGRLVIVVDDADSVEIPEPELGLSMIADAPHDVTSQEICRVSTDVPIVGAAEPCVTYGWTGQQSSSGFCDRPPATLGVFASLDRF